MLLRYQLAVLDALAPLDALSPLAVPVGDHVAPLSLTGDVVAPCAVLYLLPGGTWDDSIGCVGEDGRLPFQVTCVGETAQQAIWVADQVTGMLTPNVEVDGEDHLCRRQDPSVAADRDPDLPHLFYAPVLFRLLVRPATGS